MSESLLLKSFDQLATAPAGVASLRGLILMLAVQGKLVVQDPNDETANVLLKKIRATKDRLIAEGKVKLDKPLAGIDEEEKPFNLPVGWEWVRLGDISSYIQRGKGPSYAENSDFKVVSQKCVRWYGLDLVPARSITPESLDKYEEIRFLQANDLLWNSTGTGTIGRACLVPPELSDSRLVADSHVTVVRALQMNATYLWRWIQSPNVQNEIEGSASGTTNQIELNTSTVINHLIPLPPLEEQNRIVARVEELMKLCDALEQSGRLADEQHARLTSTLFDALAASEPAHALAENWQRVAEHFDLLLDRPEAIDALEQTLLQLAVRGLLVPQDVKDEAAEYLLSHIGESRKNLSGTAGLSTGKPSQMVTSDECPFISPAGWLWVRIESICEVQGGIQKTQLRRPIKNHFPYLRVGNVQRGRLVLDRIERYELTDDEVQKWALKAGDLLVVEGNGSADEIGRCAIWNGSITPCVFQNHLMRVRPDVDATVEFLTLFLNSPDGMAEMKRLAITTSGLYNLSVGKIRNIPVPLPPLTEQQRIVSRLRELRLLCAQLRKRLTDSRQTQSTIADALAAQAAAG